MQGLGRAVVIDETLHFILYTGTRLHYYDLYEADVERILDSIETVAGRLPSGSKRLGDMEWSQR